MVASMTGFGVGRAQSAGLEVSVEARSVNGRFLKVGVRGPPSTSTREPEIEALLKQRVRRGTVSVALHLRRTDPERLVAINEEVVKGYQAAFRRLGLDEGVIPLLDGVVGRGGGEELSDAEWEVVLTAVGSALDELLRMREQEGRALAEILGGICDRMDTLRAAVRERAPVVVQEYQQKLTKRLATLLAGSEVTVDPQMIAREVALVADRADITEELDRLGSHLDQVRRALQDGAGAGRTLDFLSQELLREVNTIGSKSSDADIAHLVVELKSAIEQFKEQAANVE